MVLATQREKSTPPCQWWAKHERVPFKSVTHYIVHPSTNVWGFGWCLTLVCSGSNSQPGSGVGWRWRACGLLGARQGHVVHVPSGVLPAWRQVESRLCNSATFNLSILDIPHINKLKAFFKRLFRLTFLELGKTLALQKY